MGTKNNPRPNDCYHKAASDEPMFILLARDILAPGLVLDWAMQRETQIDRGVKPRSDMEKVREARSCAAEMMRWRNNNAQKK